MVSDDVDMSPTNGIQGNRQFSSISWEGKGEGIMSGILQVNGLTVQHVVTDEILNEFAGRG
ncbi:MAG: hypothetical protein DRH08_09505 [Deltaproteobacteria bacterium]|nr:MAG: hypothetical protein DRH08_09505 [Deltaproteobacteria bacterium]